MNIIRIQTLFQKECLRFLRVYNQTIISPVVNSLMLFLIFTFALNRGDDNHKAIIAVGLVIMTALQAAYFNTQSTITVAKVLGFIKDYTITPLTSMEILIAFCIASCIRGLLVGVLTFVALIFVCDFTFQNFIYPLYYFIAGMFIFSFLGVIIGFISADFDKSQAYSSYIIVPLTMLSGTFYSIVDLPPFWQKIILLNPVFYIIDGFRNGIMGIHGSHNTMGLVVTGLSLPILLYIAMFFLKRNLQKIDY
jgi:ABC-2 type transport system permease protein